MTISPVSTNVVPNIARAARAAAPAAPPASEASLLNALTDEERAYFRQLDTAGPLTYGRGGASAPRVDAPLGQHLDVTA